MASTSTKPPSGTRDFLPDEIRKRQHVVDIIRGTYEKYGFEPLETPAFENIETLLGKYGDEGNKLIFKILKRGEHEHTGEADLALRYDLTVPLARVVAQYQNELPKFFKRYQIQPVWRADRPARGRFREFYQCDVDTIGSASPVVEAEQLSAVADILSAFQFRDAQIKLNHRGLLTALLEVAGVPQHQHGDLLIALDKFDKIGRDGVVDDIRQRGYPAEVATRVVELLMPSAVTARLDPQQANDWILQHLRSVVSSHPVGNEALTSIEEIISITSRETRDKIVVLPSLARGLSYYTGAILEVGVHGIGSLGGGGRYDNLIGMFLGRDIPACGFSLGLERIIVIMTERNMFPPHVAGSAVDVMVTMWDDASLRAEAIALAQELRRELRAEVYPEPDKLGKQFKYAADRRVPFVAVQGSNEREKNVVTVKDLRTGEQHAVGRAEVARFIRERLGAEARGT